MPATPNGTFTGRTNRLLGKTEPLVPLGLNILSTLQACSARLCPRRARSAEKKGE